MTNREKYNLNKDIIIKQRLSGRVIREIGEEFDIPKGSLIQFLEKDHPSGDLFYAKISFGDKKSTILDKFMI